QLPWDRPDASRRESVRSSLLVAASDAPPRRSNRGFLVGAGFVAGVLAAAAVALVLARSSSSQSPSIASHSSSPSPPPPSDSSSGYAHLEPASGAVVEHSLTTTASGVDEVVRVRSGAVHVAIPDHARVHTKSGDADIEGTGAYDVVVANDRLASIRVSSGSA